MLGKLKSDLESEQGEATDIKPPVVFSPGATSFGMFNNEFDRGEKFMTAVKNLLR
jgi:UDP-N-acetylmuramoylalanine--D-glutamate ligase